MLIKSYNIETKKLLFPYKFVNKDNLKYCGHIPDFYSYFNKYTDESFKKYLELVSKYKNKK
jgi:hypothetical protein